MKHPSKRAFTWFGAAVAVMALLISARLLLVTGHPRRAVADPSPAPVHFPQAAPMSAPGKDTPAPSLPPADRADADAPAESRK